MFANFPAARIRGDSFFIMENLPSKLVITEETVKATFALEAQRLNYQKVLQAVENIKFTPENVNEDLLEPGKLVLRQIAGTKETLKRPLLDAGKIVEASYKAYFNPLEEVINRKAEEKKAVALKIFNENRLIQLEREKQEAISKSISDFIFNATNFITNATDDSQIVLIQKRIGTETSREGYYEDQLTDLKERCNSLKPIIESQKKIIRELKEIERQQAEAEAAQDEERMILLREKREEIVEILDETKIKLQEKAFEQVATHIPVYVGESVTDNVRASRTTWKYRVDNIELLAKKMPHLVTVIPNDEKIKELLAVKRADGSLKGKMEESFFGITFYEDKSFK